ncbi:Aspartic peptidase domain superfamily [Sesbania bispinosa]|nr:Aspartic peptidase domain superfamily [Sesbania bispinosa]
MDARVSSLEAVVKELADGQAKTQMEMQSSFQQLLAEMQQIESQQLAMSKIGGNSTGVQKKEFRKEEMKADGSGYGHSTATTVKLGDGNRKLVQGRCKGVSVELEELKIIIDSYVFDIGEVDLILGIEWLATLGEVTTDWKKNVMKFEYEGRKIEFKGEDNEGGKQDSLLCFLNQELQEIDGLMWPSNIQKAVRDKEEGLTKEQETNLQLVLQKFP